MKKKYFSMFLLFLSISLIVTACSSKDPLKHISKTLGINLSKEIISESTDSHGGMNGDGTTYIKMMLPDGDEQRITESIKNNEGWRNLPLTDNLNTVVYGKNYTGPYAIDDDGNQLIPSINNGYYFFIDRQEEGINMKDDKNLLYGSSFNFTLAIYDTDNETLYYFESDS